jgi:ketosteroid isomerase-like protein
MTVSADAAVRELLDREKIKETKYKYFRALDTRDFALLQETLTEDVVINYGPMGKYHSRQAFIDIVKPINTQAGAKFAKSCGLHHALNPEITLTSDVTADCRWVTYYLGFDADKNGYLQQSGSYVDQYRKEGGVWRICTTTYTLWFHQNNTMGAWTPLFPDGPSLAKEQAARRVITKTFRLQNVVPI